MFKRYFEGINGIEIYPVILLVIFFLFFVSMSVWMIRSNNLMLKEQSKIPLEGDGANQDSSN